MIWDPTNGMRELQPLLVAEHGLDFAGTRLWLAVPSDDGDELTCLLAHPSPPGDLEGAVIFLDPAVPALPYGFGLAAVALLLSAGRVQLARRGPTSPDGSR